MARAVPIMKGALGLNNVVDPMALTTDDRGRVELAAAVNVDIDNRYRPGRRDGYSKISDGVFHSLHRNGNAYFAVKDGELVVFDSNYTMTSLTPVANQDMFYGNVGATTYFSNGIQKGYVEYGQLYPWVAADYYGPDTTRALSGPPDGTLLEYFQGVMFMAVGRVLYHSEAYNLGLWNLAANYIPFESPIQMIASFGNTLIVSDQHAIYAHTGQSVKNWSQTKIFDSPAIKGTARVLRQVPNLGDGIMFVTTEGICFINAEGQLTNLTKDRLVLPNSSVGTAYQTNTHYVCITR